MTHPIHTISKLLLALVAGTVACGDNADTTSSATDGGTGSTGQSTSSSTGGPVEPTTGDSDSGTSGSTTTDSTSTGSTSTDPTTSTSTTTSTSSTTMPVDPCDPDPCDPPQQCVDGTCVDPGPPGEGQVIAVEMMVNPLTLFDSDAEWIELKNIGDQYVDLDGCELRDLGVNGDAHTIDAGGPLVLAPGALMVLAKTAVEADNGGIADVAYAFGDAFSLTNEGDAFVLRCGDVDVDIVEYDAMTWPLDPGLALQLDPGEESAEANDAPAAWCAATVEYHPENTGSPGAANLPCP